MCWIQNSRTTTGISLCCLWYKEYVPDIWVFQGQPTQVGGAHGYTTTDEDEEGDQLVGTEQNLCVYSIQASKCQRGKFTVYTCRELRSEFNFYLFNLNQTKTYRIYPKLY